MLQPCVQQLSKIGEIAADPLRDLFRETPAGWRPRDALRTSARFNGNNDDRHCDHHESSDPHGDNHDYQADYDHHGRHESTDHHYDNHDSQADDHHYDHAYQEDSADYDHHGEDYDHHHGHDNHGEDYDHAYQDHSADYDHHHDRSNDSRWLSSHSSLNPPLFPVSTTRLSFPEQL